MFTCNALGSIRFEPFFARPGVVELADRDRKLRRIGLVEPGACIWPAPALDAVPTSAHAR